MRLLILLTFPQRETIFEVDREGVALNWINPIFILNLHYYTNNLINNE
jgi:hypothetical protein